MNKSSLTSDERHMLEQLVSKPIIRTAPDLWEKVGRVLEDRGLVRRTSLNPSDIYYEITAEGRIAIGA